MAETDFGSGILYRVCGRSKVENWSALSYLGVSMHKLNLFPFVTLLVVAMLSGCGLASDVRIVLGDWSPSSAQREAENDLELGRAKIFYAGIGPCVFNAPIGIASADLDKVKNLPAERLPCGCAYRNQSERRLCAKQRAYAEVYNQRIVSLLKNGEASNRQVE